MDGQNDGPNYNSEDRASRAVKIGRKMKSTVLDMRNVKYPK